MSEFNKIELHATDGTKLFEIETPIADQKGFKNIDVPQRVTSFYGVHDSDLEEFAIKILSVLGYKIRT
jgi:hypothetical protein